MCGRVRLSSDYSEIKIRLKFALDAPAPNFEPDWNKPPTAPMLVAIRSVDGKRVPKMMKWGLIPRWAKDDKIQYSTHNARSEEFRNKPAFRDAWKRGQRCLVVTDGYYEWKVLDPKGKKKQAYAIAMADDREMVMAGLWETWKSPTSGEEILSCTIMTCAPNQSMARNTRSNACHSRRGGLAEVAWRGTGDAGRIVRAAQAEPGRSLEDVAGRQVGRQRPEQGAAAHHADRRVAVRRDRLGSRFPLVPRERGTAHC